MRDAARAEEGVRAALSAVHELVHDDDVAGGHLLAEAAHGGDRDHVGDAQMLERRDVGAGGQIGGRMDMAAAMAGQEAHGEAVESAGQDRVGGAPQGGFDMAPFGPVELEAVEARAADQSQMHRHEPRPDVRRASGPCLRARAGATGGPTNVGTEKSLIDGRLGCRCGARGGRGWGAPPPPGLPLAALLAGTSAPRSCPGARKPPGTSGAEGRRGRDQAGRGDSPEGRLSGHDSIPRGLRCLRATRCARARASGPPLRAGLSLWGRGEDLRPGYGAAWRRSVAHPARGRLFIVVSPFLCAARPVRPVPIRAGLGRGQGGRLIRCNGLRMRQRG
jgi:hypothetical protein